MKDTALIRAAHNGHLQTVMYLAEQGADLNTLDLVRCRVTRSSGARRTERSTRVRSG